jgi:hypothetical protein
MTVPAMPPSVKVGYRTYRIEDWNVRGAVSSYQRRAFERR